MSGLDTRRTSLRSSSWGSALLVILCLLPSLLHASGCAELPQDALEQIQTDAASGASPENLWTDLVRGQLASPLVIVGRISALTPPQGDRGGVAPFTLQVATIKVLRFIRPGPPTPTPGSYEVTVPPGFSVGDEVLALSDEASPVRPTMLRGQRLSEVPLLSPAPWIGVSECERSVHALGTPYAQALLAGFERILARPQEPALVHIFASFSGAPRAPSDERMTVRILDLSGRQAIRVLEWPLADNPLSLELAAGRYRSEWPERPGYFNPCRAGSEKDASDCEFEVVAGTIRRVHGVYEPQVQRQPAD